jgi:hypothetical protein
MSQGDVQATSGSFARLQLTANANANRKVPAHNVPMHGTQVEVPPGLEEDVGENA